MPLPSDDSRYVLSEEESKRLEQVYRNNDNDITIRVFRDGGALKGQVYGQGPFDLVATSADTLVAPSIPGSPKLTFSGRGGTAETVLLEQGDVSMVLRSPRRRLRSRADSES